MIEAWRRNVWHGKKREEKRKEKREEKRKMRKGTGRD